MDIMEYQRESSGIPIYSFLSLTWGYLSDLDIGSENLRFLGGLRFEVYGVWRLIFVNKYKGNLSWDL
jgi:sphingosine kinase